LQLFIAEITLFFKKQDLDLAIGLDVTIMLVMYTMYQSISQILPATAYLKFIDIWLMFCLLVLFFVFVVQVLSKIEMAPQIEQTDSKSSKKNNFRIKNNLAFCTKFSIPIFTFVFMGCYIAVAISYYSNP
jgi:Ca2+/Na+ antiporter